MSAGICSQEAGCRYVKAIGAFCDRCTKGHVIKLPKSEHFPETCLIKDCPLYPYSSYNAENQRRGAKAKLSYAKVKKIKKLYKNGKTMRELGKMFEISHTNISKAIRGKSWAQK